MNFATVMKTAVEMPVRRASWDISFFVYKNSDVN